MKKPPFKISSNHHPHFPLVALPLDDELQRSRHRARIGESREKRKAQFSPGFAELLDYF